MIGDHEVKISEPYAKKNRPTICTEGLSSELILSIADYEICEATKAYSARRITKKIGGQVRQTAQVLLYFDQCPPQYMSRSASTDTELATIYPNQ